VVLTPELLTKMSRLPTSVSAWATAELDGVEVGHVHFHHMGIAALAFNFGAQGP
jgi:predicted metal-dependent RNase